MRKQAALGMLVAALALVVCSGWAAPARANTFEKFGGHVSLGYSRLFITKKATSQDTSKTSSPGGSLSVGAGVDYPLSDAFKIGGDVGFALLGSRTIESESQIANLDYTLFETALLLHWLPTGLGPIARVSFGPALESARAELSTSGGGLAFSGFAVEEIAPGAWLDVTVLKKASRSPVIAGLEVGVHMAFLPDETWTIASAKLAIHY